MKVPRLWAEYASVIGEDAHRARRNGFAATAERQREDE